MCARFIPFQVHLIFAVGSTPCSSFSFPEKYVRDDCLLRFTPSLPLQCRLVLLVTSKGATLIQNGALNTELERQERATNMAMMTELFYDGMEPAWSYSAFHDYTDHNHRHELDPQFTQDYITRDMQPPINIKCCSKCEDKLREALTNIPGVDSVVSTHYNKKLVVTGSADKNTIHYALKHIQKRHRHLLPQKLHNLFRLLFPRHTHSRFTPSWNQTSSATGPHTRHDLNYYENDDNWNYGSKYGHGYGQAPEHRYKPGSLRQILFDSHWSSHTITRDTHTSDSLLPSTENCSRTLISPLLFKMQK